MKFSTAISPHISSQNRVSNLMLQVLQALIPAILMNVLVFGGGILIQLGLAIIAGLIAESSLLWLQKKPIKQGLSDLSAVVTAVLLALSLPILAPWWLVVEGVLFALIVGKHVYGGLGYNVFNPAMVGYAFLLISFPQPMTAWLAFDAPDLSLFEIWHIIFDAHFPDWTAVDALARATPLDTIKSQLRLQHTLTQIDTLPVFGGLAGKSYQWIAVCYLIGGLWLIKRKVIRWHIPLGVLGTIACLALLGFMYDSEHFSSPVLHLVAGSSFLGAFFIATDPVTAATSDKGRLIYAGLIGSLVYIIRTWGGYPDGMAFAVLLGNLSVPLIDSYTRPKIYGESP